MPEKKMLVVQVAALGWELVQRHGLELPGLTFQPTASIFPALTCPVQATIRTAALPAEHGMHCNGVYDRRLRKPFFWEQSAAQVSGSRIWDDFRTGGGTVGMLFWQQSLGERVDWVLSPAPIHRHHGGMIQDCAGRPDTLYPRLRKALKRPFNLMRYWGPLASPDSSQWIAEATASLMACPAAPHLLMTYLPALDYDLQRYGPSDPRCGKAWRQTVKQLTLLANAAARHGYELTMYGDYAIADCPGGALYPNRILREAGLLTVRPVKRMAYLDAFHTPAFAMVDHEIAHVYATSDAHRAAAADVLRTAPGISDVYETGGNGPDLVAVAGEGHWFSYRWWDSPREAPDYAAHVDIHNKPGFDPCELFFGWPPGSVSQNDRRIGGTHGRTGPGREVAWASTCLEASPGSLLDLSRSLGTWLGAPL
ncbi:MAG: alkaline phosphatase family protein [Kiritimatiellae bacterium]|nr:alkaline phosphatase family protein [Kiritimatiellia bacterium]